VRRASGTLPDVFDAPEYADFYVSVLTIVPIVLISQFVIWRLPDAGSPRERRANRIFTVLAHGMVGLLAAVTIGTALAVLAGAWPDARPVRGALLGLTLIQVAWGILGAVREALGRRHP
jgi:hypothetical protein